jgi:hypothetical protein
VQRERRARKRGSAPPDQPIEPPAGGTQVAVRHDDDGRLQATISTDTHPKVNEICALCGVDDREWEIEWWQASTSDAHRKRRETDLVFDDGKISGTVRDHGDLHVETLWHVKVRFRRRWERSIDDEIAYYREQIAAAPRRQWPAVKRRRATGVRGEFAMPDLHIGRLAHAEISGEDYDVERACTLAREAVADALPFLDGVDSITFPVGHDVLNVDSLLNTTTKGTRQDEAALWQMTFRAAKQVHHEIIEQFATIAPVDVIVVPGNHDEQRSWYLGEEIAAWFRGHKRVTVDATIAPRVYRRFGATLIGYSHGHREVPRELSTMMMREAPREDVLDARVFEFHHGHLHTDKAVPATGYGEGVMRRFFSTLAPAGTWESGKYGTASQLRASHALRYEPDGTVTERKWHPLAR